MTTATLKDDFSKMEFELEINPFAEFRLHLREQPEKSGTIRDSDLIATIHMLAENPALHPDRTMRIRPLDPHEHPLSCWVRINKYNVSRMTREEAKEFANLMLAILEMPREW